MIDETRQEDIAELVQIARALQSTLDLARALKERLDDITSTLGNAITDLEDIQGELEDHRDQVEHLKDMIQGEDEEEPSEEPKE